MGTLGIDMLIMVFKSFDAADIANQMISDNMSLPNQCVNAGTGEVVEGMTGATSWAMPQPSQTVSGSWWLKKPEDQYIANLPGLYNKVEHYCGPGTITPEASTISITSGDVVSTQSIDMLYTIVDTTGSF